MEYGMKVREYVVLWYPSYWGPIQENRFTSTHRAGSKANLEDAESYLKRRYGYKRYIEIERIYLADDR